VPRWLIFPDLVTYLLENPFKHSDSLVHQNIYKGISYCFHGFSELINAQVCEHLKVPFYVHGLQATDNNFTIADAMS